MMEFITSRATLVICGVVLMAAVAIPMSQMLTIDENNRMDELVENDARAIDSLYESGYDEVYLKGSELLPSSGYWLSIDGHLLTIHTSEGEVFTSAVAHGADGIELGYGDVVTLTRENGSFTSA